MRPLRATSRFEMVIDGWLILAHPLFLEQMERLSAAVEKARSRDPAGYQNTANAKLLASLRELMFHTIPQDPTRPGYRQGSTLGPDYRHWFRAKFGGQRFRLFFRFSSEARIIIYAWVNDETTLRTYGSRTDAYAVFRSMLDDGNPPDDWVQLFAAASSKRAAARLDEAR